MKKGVIMDIEREYLTMLTPEGEFIKTKNQNENYQLGEELVFFPLHEEEVSRRSIMSIFQIRTNKVKWISALTAILLIVSFTPAYLNEDVYAYMSIDINPSFEIGLDRNLEVIEIDALNEEAELILQQIDDWKNIHVDTVTETIIGKSRDNGYLNEGKEIIITTVIEEDKLDDEVDELQDQLHEDLTTLSNSYKEDNIVITTIKSNEETRDIAKEQGISTGKLIQQERQKPVKNGKQKETTKENLENNTGNTNENNPNKSEHINEKNIEQSQKQDEKNERTEQRDKQKQQREKEKELNKNQKGTSDEAEIKKGNGKTKAVEVKDHRNSERGSKNKDTKVKERHQEKQQQKHQENHNQNLQGNHPENKER